MIKDNRTEQRRPCFHQWLKKEENDQNGGEGVSPLVRGNRRGSDANNNREKKTQITRTGFKLGHVDHKVVGGDRLPIGSAFGRADRDIAAGSARHRHLLVVAVKGRLEENHVLAGAHQAHQRPKERLAPSNLVVNFKQVGARAHTLES